MSSFKLLAVLAFLTAASGAAIQKCNNGTSPMQIHLAYAGNTGMTVSWNTFGKLSKPSVKWGTNPNRLDHEASSDVSVTYQSSSTYNNHVLIENLEPDTLYYYLPQCASKPSSFRTSRPCGDSKPFTFAAVVDLGTMG